MNFLTPELLQLGSIAVLFLFFIREFFVFLKNKNNKNDGKNDIIIMEELQQLKNNHIHEISSKIDGLRERLKDLDNKNEKVIEILIEIKTILLKNGFNK